VRPTAAGTLLLEHAGAILERLAVAHGELERLKDPMTRRLRVGAFPTALAELVPRAVRTLQTTHPGVDLTLREGTTPAHLRSLAADRTDVAVVSGDDAPPDDVDLEPIFHDPLLVALPSDHRLARHREVDLDALAAERWVAGSAGQEDTLLGVWPSLPWEPDIAFVARDWTAKLGLVAAGLGITVVPALAATSVRPDVRLVEIRAGAAATRTVAVATRPEADSAVRRAFLEALRSSAADLSREVALRTAT
jgi:DNA-binding transcriptional LysR family regulator